MSDRIMNSSLHTKDAIAVCPSIEKSDHKGRFITKIALIFLFAALPGVSGAQVNVEWSNDPGGVALALDQMHNVYSANWDYNPGGDISLTKRHPDGNVIWTVSFDNTDDTRHEVVTWLATDSQNNCLVAGTIRSGFSSPVNAASLLMKYDSDGSLIWRTVFESTFEGSYTKKVLVDQDDNIYVLGLGMGDNGLVTRVKKFDSAGVALWTYYDENGIGAPMNFKMTPDNALLISARSVTGILSGYLKLSFDGNLIWSKSGIASPTVGDAAGDAYGNTYIINGENVISNAGSILEKFDASGTLLWSQMNDMGGNKVEVGSDDNAIISGFPGTGLGGAAFMKYNSDATIAWENLNADGPENLLLHGTLILDAQNNAYLSAGNLFNMAVCKVNATGTNGWVALVSGSNSALSFVRDPNGPLYIIGTTTAKLAESTLHANTSNKPIFSVAPNPFDDQIKIVMHDNSRLKNVTLFSSSGVKVYENTFTEQIKSIDFADLKSGLYILRIQNQDGCVYNQKVLKN